MEDLWKKRWNDRFEEEGYAYGSLPNEYLKKKLPNLPKGKILFPAEGEGRNVVYAAELGWKAEAFDIAPAGKNKTMCLAKGKGVEVDYQVGYLEELDYQPESFDAIGLIYGHIPHAGRPAMHKRLNALLKPGGWLIIEGFGSAHLKYNSADPRVGGPGNQADLYSIEEITRDFENFEILELKEEEVDLDEGKYHVGKGFVLRFMGQKK